MKILRYISKLVLNLSTCITKTIFCTVVILFIIIAITLAGITYTQPKYSQIVKQDITAEKNVYLQCRAPLKDTKYLYSLFLKRNYTTNDLDYGFEHQHFFLVNDNISFNETKKEKDLRNMLKAKENFKIAENIIENNTYISYEDLEVIMDINDSCIKNNFQNFGFFDDNQIKCNEKIEEYTECNRIKFEESTIKEAINMMSRDKAKYNLYIGNQYNCQTFTKHMLNAYSILKDYSGPMCAQTDSNYTNINIKIKDNILSLFGIGNNQKDAKFYYDWGINPYYKSP